MDKPLKHTFQGSFLRRPQHTGALLFLGVAVALGGCKRVPTPVLDPTSCAQEVSDAFLPQDAALLAVRAKDGGSLWRSDVLTALDGLCAGYEEEQTEFDIAVKCITSVSLMESRKGAPPKMVVLRDELPLKDEAHRAWVEALGTSLEFAFRDTIDVTGTRAFVHLPLVSLDGVDLPALTRTLLAGQDLLDGELDVPGEPTSAAYAELAGDGPSARAIVGLYDAGEDGGLKEPAHLAVLEQFQNKAESLPRVAQTFTIVDDLKVTRQGLRGGTQEAFTLPRSRSEAAQLLLALSMSPATALGPRVDSRERVGLIRVNLSTVTDEQARRIARKLDGFLAQVTPEGSRALLCSEDAAP
ncbi:MAG: hypothetical protein KDA24_08780 [Deltaproteobacteria bacterium]|nr:hypothetical protein [Deltaproteobacteria bacterium]